MEMFMKAKWVKVDRREMGERSFQPEFTKDNLKRDFKRVKGDIFIRRKNFIQGNGKEIKGMDMELMFTKTIQFIKENFEMI